MNTNGEENGENETDEKSVLQTDTLDEGES